MGKLKHTYSSCNQYAERDIESIGNHYMVHIDAMTVESLHSKSDIAAELAFRDAEIESLRAQVESKWISVEDKLPTAERGTGYRQCISELVLVKSEEVMQGKKPYKYPFVAHLHKEQGVGYRSYAASKKVGDCFYTWLNPYSHQDLQLITHWMPLPNPPKENDCE